MSQQEDNRPANSGGDTDIAGDRARSNEDNYNSAIVSPNNGNIQIQD